MSVYSYLHARVLCVFVCCVFVGYRCTCTNQSTCVCVYLCVCMYVLCVLVCKCQYILVISCMAIFCTFVYVVRLCVLCVCGV